ncbi:XRE family transcriptional regulator [Hafnia alvei]|uniref:XRE family transcriptional regulator n=1 Tax=Hafnia alvei TaxID=569 RepID=UPI001034D624|nr:XRE family transcriptional regulator [Hafnia alvei]TBM18321.1 XRE family transcriptional regulator [Hafnia alvei]
MTDLALHIGKTLRELRQRRGWSLDKTAQATGVSKAMLGQIERGESSPTVVTLWRISSGLQASFSEFLPPQLVDEEPMLSLHHEDEAITAQTQLSFDAQLGYEVLLITLHAACIHNSYAHEQGVIEDILMIDGEIEVQVKGIWQAVTTSKPLRFVADQIHSYRNTSNQAAKFYNIVHYPQSREDE